MQLVREAEEKGWGGLELLVYRNLVIRGDVG